VTEMPAAEPERVVAPDETTTALPPLVLGSLPKTSEAMASGAPPESPPHSADRSSPGRSFAGGSSAAATSPGRSSPEGSPTGGSSPEGSPLGAGHPGNGHAAHQAQASGPGRTMYAPVATQPQIPAAEVPDALRGPEPEKPAKKGAGKLLGVSANQIMAGALAASTSAVAASYLGVAGTVLGAGMGSVIATVSTAVYQKSIQHSKPLLQRVTTTVVGRDGVAEVVAESRASAVAPDPDLPSSTQVGRGLPDPHLAEAPASPARPVTGHHPPSGASPFDETMPMPQPVLPNGRPGAYGSASVPPPTRPPSRVVGKVYGGGPWYAGLPWKRIAVLSATMFILVMGVITAAEWLDGRTLAQAFHGEKGTGQTSVGIHTKSAPKSTSPTPEDTTTGGPTPTDTPSGDVTPSDSASPSDTPSEGVTPSDGDQPTDQAPASAVPTENQSASPTDGVTPQPLVETNSTPSLIPSGTAG
jgi:hypothetical protein